MVKLLCKDKLNYKNCVFSLHIFYQMGTRNSLSSSHDTLSWTEPVSSVSNGKFFLREYYCCLHGCSISQNFRSYIHCGVFELGFFSSGNSTKRYLGILYKNIPTGRVAWVANQNNPISDSSGILTFTSRGNLELKQNNSVVLVTTYQNRVWDPVAELLDNGNLVIRNVGDANSATYLWQSFDYLSDTLLPKMKLGWDLRTGLEPKITSWKSPDDPSPRNFSWGLMLHDYPEFYAMIGTCKYFCTGPWNGVHFSGLWNQSPNPVYEFKYVTTNDLMYTSNKVEMFYSFTLKNSSVIARVKVKTLLLLETQVWDRTTQYGRFMKLPLMICVMYANV